MSINYSPPLPISKNGQIKTEYGPPYVAKVRTTKENAAASSILLLGHDTTELEVLATVNTAGKWLSQAVVDAKTATSVLTVAATANYDFMIEANKVRRLVVPISTHKASSGSAMGINRAEGLFPAVAYKTFVDAGVGSVMTIQL